MTKEYGEKNQPVLGT